MPKPTSQSNANRPSVWYQLYFVLAGMLGLLCIVIGASVFLNTLLTSTIFKTEQPRYNMPPQPYIDVTTLEKSPELTAEQKEALENWRKDYERWQEEQKNYNWQDESRKSSYAWSLSLLITGLPIFALHAPVVFGWGKQRA